MVKSTRTKIIIGKITKMKSMSDFEHDEFDTFIQILLDVGCKEAAEMLITAVNDSKCEITQCDQTEASRHSIPSVKKSAFVRKSGKWIRRSLT